MIAIRQDVPEHRTYWAEAEALRPKLVSAGRRLWNLRKEDAEDRAQEAVIKVALACPDPEKLTTFAFRVLERICIDVARQAKRRPVIAGEYLDFAHGSDDDAIAEIDMIGMIEELIPVQSQAIIMTMMGYDSIDAHKILGVPMGTFRSRLHRGRIMARKLAGEVEQ